MIKRKKNDKCYLKETKQWFPESKLLSLEEGEVIYKQEHSKEIQNFTNPNAVVDLSVVLTLLEFNKHKTRM